MLRYTLADDFELSVHPTRTESSFLCFQVWLPVHAVNIGD